MCENCSLIDICIYIKVIFGIMIIVVKIQKMKKRSKWYYGC